MPLLELCRRSHVEKFSFREGFDHKDDQSDRNRDGLNACEKPILAMTYFSELRQLSGRCEHLVFKHLLTNPDEPRGKLATAS